ncbi:MAG: hypothetical protein D4R81_09425 [Nitrospiraceae bacterium]|nr:MAG: hypothetical protein D4R81_09425 [Nitrospiraceae bacterium]
MSKLAWFSGTRIAGFAKGAGLGAMSNKPKLSKDPLVLVSNATHTLRVSDSRMAAWIKEGRVVVEMTPDGKPAMRRSNLKRLANSLEQHKAALEAMTMTARRRESERDMGLNEKLSRHIVQDVARYRAYIEILKEIHQSYQNRLDILNNESPAVAAYLLFSKVIGMLQMACLCLENHFWNTFMLLRPIDEAIDLAIYFIRTAPKSAPELQEWFRENRSPSSMVCREGIGKLMDEWVPSSKPFAEVLGEVYGKKSKELHNTYNGIWETHRIQIDTNGTLVFAGFDYGPSSNLEKITELSEYFQSSIWTAVQGFITCFLEHLPLEEKHLETLMGLNERFLADSIHNHEN